MALSQRIVEALQSVGADIKALLTGKQDTLVAGQNLKTINGQSLLGLGDLSISSGDTGIGYGQTWQDVKASRAFGVTYTNSTGKPIEVSVTGYWPGNGGTVALQPTIGGVVIGEQKYGYAPCMTFIVPNNTTYKVNYNGTVVHWTELS